MNIFIPLSLPAPCFWPRESLQSLVVKGQVHLLLSFAADIKKKLKLTDKFYNNLKNVSRHYAS